MTKDAADQNEKKPVGHGGVSFGFSKKRSTSALIPHRTDPEKEKDFVSETDDRSGIKSSKNPKITKKDLLVIPCPGNAVASAATTAAAEEILKESKEWLEKGPDDVTKKNEGLVVRLSGEELDSDLSKRPETSTLDDYEAVPVDGFGMGMLRGMGFNPAEGIGGFKKAAVKCIEPDVRPKGLGLGAGRPQNSSNVTLKSLVTVETGTYKGLCGRVEAVDGESARVIIKTIDGRSINVSENAVKIIEKLPEAPLKKEKKVKRKRSPSPDQVPWVQPLLRVRLIEESSKYYNSKVIVDDVIGKRRCVVRTESGRILDDVDPLRDCETLVPKAGGRVMVVKGRRKGDVGQIIDKDKRKGIAALRIRDQILKLDFDDVCEFVGNSLDDDF